MLDTLKRLTTSAAFIATLLLTASPTATKAQTATPTPDAVQPPASSTPIVATPTPPPDATTTPTTSQTPQPSRTPDATAAPGGSTTTGGQTNRTNQTTPQVEAATETISPTNNSRNRLLTLGQPRPVPPLPSLVRLGVTADNTLTLSLNDAIRRALESNNEIEIARSDVRLAETTLQAFEGIYQPIFALTPQIIYRTSPNVAQQFAIVGGGQESSTFRTVDFNLAPSVTQLVRTGGGRYEAFFNNSRSATTRGAFDASFGSELGLNITQPLFRDRAIDNNRRNIRVQRKRLEQTDADFRSRVIDIISNVQTAYWELVFALRDQQNRIANVNLARENFRLTEARVTAGAAAPLARAEVQTELSTRESELLLASQNVTLAENSLKQLIIGDPLAPAWSAAIVPTDTPLFDAAPVNLTDSLQEARQNRPELRRLRLQQDINDIDTQYFSNQTRPRVDLVSTVSTSGFAGTPSTIGTSLAPGTIVPLILPGDAVAQTNADSFLLQQINVLRTGLNLPPAQPPTTTVTANTTVSNFNGGLGRNLRNLLSFDQRNISVGVRIEFPFHNRTAQAQLAGTRIERTQLDATTRAQEQTIEVEVRNAAQQVETSRRRVLTSRIARESAELQLEGERRLFEVGRSTQFLLFQRENALVNARNLELRAETDYNQALARLQRATSTTLRANNVTIE